MQQRRTIAIACAIAGLTGGVPGMAHAKASRAASICPGAGTVPVDEASRVQASAALVCVVNRERARRGRAPLGESGLLGSAAAGHSADMVARKFFSHTGSNGSSLRQRVARTGYTRGRSAAYVGEALAWAFGSYAAPAQIVSSFLASAEHRRTLLDRRFRDVGIGLVLGSPERGLPGGATATLTFGRR